MTPTQQFYFNLITLVMTVIVTPLLGVAIAVMVKRTGVKQDEAALKAGQAVDAAGKAVVKAGEAATIAGEAAKEVTIVKGVVYELGRQLDGRLADLLAASMKAEYLRGRDEERTGAKQSKGDESKPPIASS